MRTAVGGLRCLFCLLWLVGCRAQCPQIPKMPAFFSINRELWTFWASETVWAGDAVFGMIQRRPAFGVWHDLVIPNIGVVGSSTMGFCLPWQHCSFDILDCEGQLLYKAIIKKLPSLDNPGAEVWALEFQHADSSYIGRTSKLPDLLPSLGGIKPPSTNVFVRDTGDATVSRLHHDQTQLITMSWDGGMDMQVNSPFAQVESAPLSDPRLILFFLGHQFRGQGWFGPALSALFLALCCVALYAAYRKYKAWREEQELGFMGRKLEEMRELVDPSETGSLLNRGCCAGNRPR
eukprot:gb/GFBE01049296.1/.p1 GENE.gb/GFBE01049296.1/~~gb/GFBE01049296.1/.p1  ORF type:complete len:291 (+),score=38.75 gb/GFBE01049296.1/:1-873(+)